MTGEVILLNRKYELITTTIIHEEIGAYIGYGIRYGEHAVTDISLDLSLIHIFMQRASDSYLPGYQWLYHK